MFLSSLVCCQGRWAGDEKIGRLGSANCDQPAKVPTVLRNAGLAEGSTVDRQPGGQSARGH